MTTVNETKTKINGEWVSLVPDATTSSKGIVQVGDGLSITDGVISVDGGSSTYTISASSTAILTYSLQQYASSETFDIVGYSPNVSYYGSFTVVVDGTTVYGERNNATAVINMYDIDYNNTPVTLSTEATHTVTVPSGTHKISIQVSANRSTYAPVNVFFKVT